MPSVCGVVLAAGEPGEFRRTLHVDAAFHPEAHGRERLCRVDHAEDGFRASRPPESDRPRLEVPFVLRATGRAPNAASMRSRASAGLPVPGFHVSPSLAYSASAPRGRWQCGR